MTSAISVKDVRVSLGGRLILEDVSLSVDAHDFLAILGPNGGGKTTLLRVLLGLLRPDVGSVEVLGESPQRARGRIGYVPQRSAFDLDFPVSVLDVVLMGRLPRRPILKAFRERDRVKCTEALDRLGVADLKDTPIGSLSGGQLQRVLIARALAMEPELLLLDEPTSALDEGIVGGVWDLLAQLTEEMTVIVVTHDVGAISSHVKHVACLNRCLHAHPTEAITSEILEQTYGCPVDLLAHGQPHRVFEPHDHGTHGHGGGE